MSNMTWNSLKATFGLNNLASKVSMERLEAAIFTVAGSFSDDYNGGQWKEKKIGDVTFVYPDAEKDYSVHCSTNYYDGKMDAVTFGAALCLKLANDLCWSLKGDDQRKMCDHFYKMRDSILDSKELNAVEIIRFLD